MKRLALLILVVCCTGCVNEVVRTVQTLTIRVQPYDTIQTTSGSTISYEIRSLVEDAALPETSIDISPAYLNKTERVQTDAEGLLHYSTQVPDSLAAGSYAIKFKGHKFQYGSSSTETRYLTVAPQLPPVGSVDIVARGVRPDGSIAPEPISPTSKMHARSSMPLLPYLFFEAGKSDIPARYERIGSTGFTVNSLAGMNAEDANHHLLDVIGLRLKEYPQANVSITGTNSNAGVERGNVTLSRTRAQQVRDYLVTTWGIEAGRVTVDARNLPEIPTNPVTAAGMEENRRVEFASNDSRITAPVKIEQWETMSGGETIIRFETTFQPAGLAIESWRITLFHNDVQIGQALTGSGTPPPVQTMTIGDATTLINEPLRYRLEATDAFGRVLTDEGMTRIVPATVERSNLEKFAMLYFDFDRADINEHARQMLELISESISRDARVLKIDGFTDETGTEDYNQMLSEARANAAAMAIRAMTTLPAATNVTGHGERDPKFYNDLPEGRQLNRRCEFTIEKSI